MTSETVLQAAVREVVTEGNVMKRAAAVIWQLFLTNALTRRIQLNWVLFYVKKWEIEQNF